MDAETITLATPDGPMDVYVARSPSPADPPRAVIVVQEAFGVNEHIEDVTRRFAGAGYLAVAPHLFHRSGGGTIAYDDRDGMARHVAAVADEHTLDDLDAVLEWLRTEGIDDRRVGVVGFCFGGRVAFLVATRRSIGAAVGFYGGGIVHARSDARPSLLPGVPAMQTPWLGLFGDADESIPADDVEAIEAALASAPVSTEVHVYANAGHAFLNDTRPDRHVPEAAGEAWSRTLTWFDEHLAGG